MCGSCLYYVSQSSGEPVGPVRHLPPHDLFSQYCVDYEAVPLAVWVRFYLLAQDWLANWWTDMFIVLPSDVS